MVQTATHPATVADSHRQGASLRARAAVAQFGSLFHDGIHCRGDEIRELNLRHGAHTRHGCANGRAYDDALRKRGIDYSRASELSLQSLGRFEYSAHRPNVFPNNKHALIAGHLLTEGAGNRVDISHDRHPGTSAGWFT